MATTLIAQLRDDEGRVLIPGFYADVRPLTPADRQAIRDLPPVENALKRVFGIDRTEGEEGLEASLMRPGLNIRGIRSGRVGAAAAKENLRLQNLWDGVQVYAAMMGALSW